MSKNDEFDYDKEAGKIRSENALLLEGFGEWLTASGLKEKTIRRHQENGSFYINDYLVYDDLDRPQDGLSAVGMFFNWFFPRKAMWSGVTSTKETVAGLKKFYRYLVEIGLVEVEDYQVFLATVKAEMPKWLGHYDDIRGW